LNLTTPHSVGAPLPTPVAGQASYVSGSLGGSALDPLGPQALLDNLPANLQPGSTLFDFNPQAEDLMLQQAALQQTGNPTTIGSIAGNVVLGVALDRIGNAGQAAVAVEGARRALRTHMTP